MIKLKRTKNFLKFKKKIVPNNLVNHNEIQKFLDKLSVHVPEAKVFINQKVKKYLYTNLAFIEVDNENHLKDEEDRHKFNQLKVGEYTQVVLTKVLFNDILKTMVFLREQGLVHSRISYNQLRNKYLKVERNNLIKKILREGEIEEIRYFYGGEKIVKLKNHQACLRESHLMKNCLDSYYAQQNYHPKFFLDGIFSFRDKNNKSLASLHLKQGRLIDWRASCNEKIRLDDLKFKNLIIFIKQVTMKNREVSRHLYIKRNNQMISEYASNMNRLKISLILLMSSFFYFF